MKLELTFSVLSIRRKAFQAGAEWKINPQTPIKKI